MSDNKVKLLEPPSWFNLKDYEVVENFDIGAWHFNLLLRRESFYSDSHIYLSFSNDGYDKARTKDFWILNDYPNITFSTEQWVFVKISNEDEQSFLNACSNGDFSLLPNISLSHIYNHNSISYVGLNVVDEYNKLKATHRNKYLEEQREANFAMVYIDTSSSDEKIIEDLRKFLKKHKSNIKLKKFFTIDEIKKLINRGVLPMLDLLIYAQKFNYSITNDRIADWCYDPSRGVDEREVRKWKKDIEYYLSHEYIGLVGSSI